MLDRKFTEDANSRSVIDILVIAMSINFSVLFIDYQ